jgi:hypothetical protein
MKRILFSIAASLALLMGAGISRAGADETSWTTQSQAQAAPLMFAKASTTNEVKIASTEDSAKDSDGSGLWVSVYTGYDYANMGDIAATNKSFNGDLPAFGDTGTLYADHSGILAGLKFGLDLDKSDSIFLAAEGVWSSRQGVIVTSGPEAGFTDYQDPSMMDLSLNYSLALVNAKGCKTLLSVGSGLYAGSVRFNGNEFGNQVVGDFGQANIGGSLGLSEELSMGGALSFNCGVRFRAADFGKLVSNNFTVNGSKQSGPYVLVDDVGPPTLVGAGPTSSGLPPGDRYTDLDYTGFDAILGLTLSL